MVSVFNLNGLGINDVAYSKCEALRMISCLEEQGIPVLGGDVFLLKDNIPSLTFDNWYCDKVTILFSALTRMFPKPTFAP